MLDADESEIELIPTTAECEASASSPTMRPSVGSARRVREIDIVTTSSTRESRASVSGRSAPQGRLVGEADGIPEIHARQRAAREPTARSCLHEQMTPLQLPTCRIPVHDPLTLKTCAPLVALADLRLTPATSSTTRAASDLGTTAKEKQPTQKKLEAHHDEGLDRVVWSRARR